MALIVGSSPLPDGRLQLSVLTATGRTVTVVANPAQITGPGASEWLDWATRELVSREQHAQPED